jgi:hypothetical protein
VLAERSPPTLSSPSFSIPQLDLYKESEAALRFNRWSVASAIFEYRVTEQIIRRKVTGGHTTSGSPPPKHEVAFLRIMT